MTDRADTFNRANSTTTLGTPSDAGSAWAVNTGTWGILSNAAYQVSGSFTSDFASVEASVTNAAVQATTLNSLGRGGVVGRANAAANDSIAWYCDGSSVFLAKFVGGVVTFLGNSGSTASVTNDRLKLLCESTNQLTGFLNDVALVSVSDSALNTRTQWGIITYDKGVAGMDDFSVTRILAAIPTLSAPGATSIAATTATPQITVTF